MSMIRWEIQTMRKLNHPNIVKFYEVYEDTKYLHLVMEHCEGGDLFDKLLLKKFYHESEAVFFI
jgi:calcium-dependent protein kinase